jgi:hypothetical protein
MISSNFVTRGVGAWLILTYTHETEKFLLMSLRLELVLV